MTRAIITSASNKFYPSLLNFIGSIKKTDPEHPPIHIYDLGLSFLLKKELQRLEKVHVVTMPKFTSFWRKCYTWKTYIFTQPIADTNLYIDAGNQVLQSLAPLFELIEKDGYLFIKRDLPLSLLTPKEYYNLFQLGEEDLKKENITAGILGFTKEFSNSKTLQNLHSSSLSGLCLGYSKEELWKNKGVNKNEFVRDCKKFRHDTTLLSLHVYKDFPDAKLHDTKDISLSGGRSEIKDHLLWNLRMNYVELEYLDERNLRNNKTFIGQLNRFLIRIFLMAKRIRLKLKNIPYDKF